MGLYEDYMAAAQQQVLADRYAQLGGATPGGAIAPEPAVSQPQAAGDLNAILTQMAQQIPAGGRTDPLANQTMNRADWMESMLSPGGSPASAPKVGGLYGDITSNPDTSALLAQRLQEAAVSTVLRNAGIGPIQPFGTASVGDMAESMSSGLLGGGLGNISSGFGPNGDDAGLGPFGGGALTSGFNASPDAQGFGVNVGPADYGSNIGVSPIGDVGRGDVSIGNTPNGEQVSVNPSTGVVSVGGNPVGVVGGESTGGGGATGGGGYGGEGGGIGLGGVADGSSNAGIGGPGGTGAVGGAGDAGQGTGGPGEGDQFGDQYIVPGAGPPDSVNARLRVSPGELITVTPPGRGFGQRAGGGGDPRTGIGELNAILRHMAMPAATDPRDAQRAAEMAQLYATAGQRGYPGFAMPQFDPAAFLRILAQYGSSGTQGGGGASSAGPGSPGMGGSNE